MSYHPSRVEHGVVNVWIGVASWIFLGLVASVPLPALAWWLSVRRRLRRAARVMLIAAGSVLSYFSCIGVYYATRVPSTPQQHSQFAGVEGFLNWIGVGVFHALTLAVLLTLAWRRSSAHTADLEAEE